MDSVLAEVLTQISQSNGGAVKVLHSTECTVVGMLRGYLCLTSGWRRRVSDKVSWTDRGAAQPARHVADSAATPTTRQPTNSTG